MDMKMYEPNAVLEKLPPHLIKLVIEQPYNEYTAQDHAVWRYVMRQNVRYLPRVAHESYLGGLKRTGIGIERIPHMYGMNRILKEIGWAAVAVDGFIPPSAFMEFQAYNVLVIAADIRPIDQIEYTPAPDIIHEAAGHAPIIADEEYAEYLRLFGQIGYKAISSPHDYKLYEAIRHLSILKADPNTPKADIELAESYLLSIEKSMGGISEMAQIRNLHWWTVEYGLVGEIKAPKIYGAGLLSSIGESYSCLQPNVKKIPYTIDAKNVLFDITTRQPQLFVTPDFNHLNKVLLEFEASMAIKKGGNDSIQKAIKSNSVTTHVYSSGLQVSGIISKAITDRDKLIYISTTGPTILSVDNIVLKGHGLNHHPHGFGSPVGMLKGCQIPLEEMNETEIRKNGIIKNENVRLEFNSGLVVRGLLRDIVMYKEKNVLFTFENCIVNYEDEVLFQPAWGIYDMAAGKEIVSVFSGPADPVAYGLEYKAPEEKTHKIVHDGHTQKLHSYYQEARNMREEDNFDAERIMNIWQEVKVMYPNDWLLPLELLELTINNGNNGILKNGLIYHLQNLKRNPAYMTLIENALKIIDEKLEI